MNRGTHSRAALRSTLLALALSSTLATVAVAGELTVTWRGNDDDATAGYSVEVRGDDGRLVQTIDAGEKTRLVLKDLPDNTPLSIAIRPYDQAGNPAREASRPIVTLAEPRIDAVEGEQAGQGRFKLMLLGANFADGAQAHSRRGRVQVLSTTVLRPDAAIVDVAIVGGASRPLTARDLTIANPVRRAAEYLDAHPELFDIDRSGTVDEADLQAIDGAFGLMPRAGSLDAALDLNRDGVIDGEDAAPLRRHLLRQTAAAEPSGTEPTAGPAAP